MRNTRIISISGKMGSGKDTAGTLIKNMLEEHLGPYWTIRKFAAELKKIASLILRIPVDRFESQEFKDSNLPECWNNHKAVFHNTPEYCGWKVETKPMTVREFLQKLGTDAMRDGLHENIWVNMLISQYEELAKLLPNEPQNSFPRWIVTDTRFPNEYEALKNKNALFIKIERPGLKVNNHISETALDKHHFDYIIDNSGDIFDLERELKTILIKENYL